MRRGAKKYVPRTVVHRSNKIPVKSSFASDKEVVTDRNHILKSKRSSLPDLKIPKDRSETVRKRELSRNTLIRRHSTPFDESPTRQRKKKVKASVNLEAFLLIEDKLSTI